MTPHQKAIEAMALSAYDLQWRVPRTDGGEAMSNTSGLSIAEIQKRLAALSAYEMSMMRINEQSKAADREFDRVLLAKSKLRAMLSEAKGAKPWPE
jgi:hypothetical protein